MSKDNRRPNVFLDTSVLKGSVDTRMVLLPRKQKVPWGDSEIEIDMHDPVYINDNVKYINDGNLERFEDTLALRFIASLAKEGKIQLKSHMEVMIEFFKLPKSIGETGLFYGAPIDFVDDPFTYSRITSYGPIIVDQDLKIDLQYEFLKKVKNKRFFELQRACTAYRGPNKDPHKNQLIDAFHVLCAESANSDFFLTIDGRLIDQLNQTKKYRPKVTAITPKSLLLILIIRHPLWIWSVLKEQYRICCSGRRLNQFIQDAHKEFWT